MTDETKARWSSRKFWTMMLWQAIFTLLLCTGKLSEPAFESLTLLLLGGYLVTNVAQKVMASRNPVQA